MSSSSRLVRIESKLTRFMLSMGMDADGNPSNGGISLDKEDFDDIIVALDLFLQREQDSAIETAKEDVVFITELRADLVAKGEARWKSS